MEQIDTQPRKPPQNSSAAIGSMVCGILAVSLGCIGPLFGIPAVIMGHQSLSAIKQSKGRLTGEGFAIAGLVTGYIGLVIGLFVVLIAGLIAVPNFIQARSNAQRITCIANLKQIEGAKQTWAIQNNAAAGASPAQEDLEPYFTGGTAKIVCPLDEASTFETSYEIGDLSGKIPVCKIKPETHIIY